MKKYKGIIILFLIEILCLFLTLIAGINLEIFFIFWVFISILSIVYIYIGKPKKNICWETPDRNFFEEIRSQFTVLKNYKGLPNIVKNDNGFVSLCLIIFCIVNIVGLIITSFLA